MESSPDRFTGHMESGLNGLKNKEECKKGFQSVGTSSKEPAKVGAWNLHCCQSRKAQSDLVHVISDLNKLIN